MYNLYPFGRTSLDSFFDDFDRSFLPAAHHQQIASFRTDIRDEGDHFLLEAELPGYNKEDIDLDLKDGVLTISAHHEQTIEDKDPKSKYICRERRIGSCQRSFDISGVREKDISATFANGILALTLPKMTEEDKPRTKISIN